MTWLGPCLLTWAWVTHTSQEHPDKLSLRELCPRTHVCAEKEAQCCVHAICVCSCTGTRVPSCCAARLCAQGRCHGEAPQHLLLALSSKEPSNLSRLFSTPPLPLKPGCHGVPGCHPALPHLCSLQSCLLGAACLRGACGAWRRPEQCRRAGQAPYKAGDMRAAAAFPGSQEFLEVGSWCQRPSPGELRGPAFLEGVAGCSSARLVPALALP